MNEAYIEKFERRAEDYAARADCTKDPELKKQFKDEAASCRSLAAFLRTLENKKEKENNK